MPLIVVDPPPSHPGTNDPDDDPLPEEELDPEEAVPPELEPPQEPPAGQAPELVPEEELVDPWPEDDPGAPLEAPTAPH